MNGEGSGWRFIPAPAGNTIPASFEITLKAVHPRACGEHVVRLAQLETTTGSSPRLRGTRRVEPVELHAGRFIPAPAGNTVKVSGSIVTVSVHPRACGEHPHDSLIGTHKSGSSPRLRGTRSAHPSTPLI